MGGVAEEILLVTIECNPRKIVILIHFHLGGTWPDSFFSLRKPWSSTHHICSWHSIKWHRWRQKIELKTLSANVHYIAPLSCREISPDRKAWTWLPQIEWSIVPDILICKCRLHAAQHPHQRNQAESRASETKFLIKSTDAHTWKGFTRISIKEGTKLIKFIINL